MKKKFFLIILLSCILISACNKKGSVNNPVVIIKLDTSSGSGYSPSPTNVKHKIFPYKVGDWIVFPYSGGPGPNEDSLLYYNLPRPILDSAFTLKLQNIEKVSLKLTDGSIIDVPSITTSTFDRYAYHLYETYGTFMHLNWWQLVKSTRPPVDSAFVSIKY
jgi:hypothetical protein